MTWEAIERVLQTMIDKIEAELAGTLHVVSGLNGNTVKVLLTFATFNVLIAL